MNKSFRKAALKLLPWWLLTAPGGAVVHSFALLADAAAQRFRDALRARFPSQTSESGLAYIGRERLIPRGRVESSDSYVLRLQQWRGLQGHRTRGSAGALITQLYYYFSPSALVTLVNAHGMRYRIESNSGPYVMARVSGWWHDEGFPARWSVFWVFLSSPTVQVRAGTPVAEAGQCLSVTGATPEDFDAVRQLLKEPGAWKFAGSRGLWLMVGSAYRDVPPGYSWELPGQRVGFDVHVARPDDLAFVALEESARLYVGDPSFFPEEIVTTLYGTIVGDPSTFPEDLSALAAAQTPLTDGDPGTFPESLPLPDDGQ